MALSGAEALPSGFSQATAAIRSPRLSTTSGQDERDGAGVDKLIVACILFMILSHLSPT
jgi:hypothetical protein